MEASTDTGIVTGAALILVAKWAFNFLWMYFSEALCCVSHFSYRIESEPEPLIQDEKIVVGVVFIIIIIVVFIKFCWLSYYYYYYIVICIIT